MVSLKNTALNYVPKQIKSVADLPTISAEWEVYQNNEAEFPYKYVEINGEEFKVPDSVLRDMQIMLQDNPEIKNFKVKKAGTGINTRYTVIALAS